MTFGVRGNRNCSRRYPGIKGRRPDHKVFRRREAAARLAEYNTLSVEQKLGLLNTRPGESKKQRARLLKLIETRKPQPVAKLDKEVSKPDKQVQSKPEKQVQKFMAKYKSK